MNDLHTGTYSVNYNMYTSQYNNYYVKVLIQVDKYEALVSSNN